MVRKTGEQRWLPPAFLALGFVSGIVTLAYEVVWTRELLNLLGSTTLASTIILATFMAGIAFGAWLCGRITEHAREPLWFYIFAEAALSLFGLIFPILLEYAMAITAGQYALAMLALFLLIPTFLMGIALPALAASLQKCGAVNRRYIAWLYGLNVFGGVVAVLATGFVVLPVIGVAMTGKLAATIGILAAAAAVAIVMRPNLMAGSPTALDSRPPRSWAKTGKSLLGVALFLSGVASLGYEVLWTRVLVLVVGSSTNAFALMLGLYLLGLALGSFLIGHRLAELNRPDRTFQYLQIGVAVSAVAGVGIFRFLPSLALIGYAQLGTSPGSIIAINGVLSALIILPPTIMIGASFPVAARLLERTAPRRGREFGTALGLITAGNVAGVFLAAFVAIPALGLQGGISALAALNTVAAIVLWSSKQVIRARAGLLVPGASFGVLAVAALIPSWDRAVMTSGVFRQAPIYLAMLGSADRLERAFSAYRTVFYREGREAVVAVFERPTLSGSPHRVLTIDGKVDASTGSDMATQVLSGELPLYFQPDAKKALVIGLASGVTVGTLARHPLERLDVVEIEPAVIEASRSFDAFSNTPIQDPRVKVIVGDGRRYLRSTSHRYDVIVSEPSNPWLSMSARLFTREFFQLVRSRMARRGIFVQWIPLYGLSAPQFKTLVRTLLDVFPNLSLFQVADGDLVALASVERLAIYPQILDQAFLGAQKEQLFRIGINSPADILSRWLADGEGLRTVLGDGPLNTDDNGYLEFGSPWFILTNTAPANLAVIDQASASSSFPQTIVDGWVNRKRSDQMLEDVSARLIKKRRYGLLKRMIEALHVRRLTEEADLLSGDVARAQGMSDAALRHWSGYEASPFLRRRARAAFENGKIKKSIALYERLEPAQWRGEDAIIYALARSVTGQKGEALKILDSVPAGSDDAYRILATFIRSTILLDWRGKQPAIQERHAFEVQLDRLRRCLESDGCRETIDTLLTWSQREAPGLPAGNWEALRQTIFVRITRPLQLYMRGVSKLWLGEKLSARKSLGVYLKLLPAPDPASKAHILIRSISETS